MTRLVPQAAARHPCGLRLWILAIQPGRNAAPDAATPAEPAVLRLPASAVPQVADATAQPPPPLADAPAPPLLLHAADAGLLLLVADGPPGPGPGLLLTLVDQADRAQGTALLPDPPPADPSAALAAAPGLGLALLAGAASDARLSPLTGWLAAWAAALPAATGEALADPAGHVALRLPLGASAPLALLPRPDGGLRPVPLPRGPVLDTPGGLLLRARLGSAPVAVVVITADGPARLAVARCPRPALDQAVAEAVRRLAPDHAGTLAPALPAEVRTNADPPAERPPAPGTPAAAHAAPAPSARTDPAGPRPAILLAAGVESPFARRLLFLLAPDLAREVTEVLLFGADPRAEAAWLRPRFPIPIRAAPPLWQARARAALAPARLLPIGPSGLAALAAGDAAALHAHDTVAARLLALSDALGDDEAAVLHLAGDVP